MLCGIPSAFCVSQPSLIAFNSIWEDYMHSKFIWVVTFYSISITFSALARLCLTPNTPHVVRVALRTNSLLASFFHYSFIHYFYYIHMCSFTVHFFLTPILFTCDPLPSIYSLLLFYSHVIFYLPFIHYFYLIHMWSFTFHLFTTSYFIQCDLLPSIYSLHFVYSLHSLSFHLFIISSTWEEEIDACTHTVER